MYYWQVHIQSSVLRCGGVQKRQQQCHIWRSQQRTKTTNIPSPILFAQICKWNKKKKLRKNNRVNGSNRPCICASHKCGESLRRVAVQVRDGQCKWPNWLTEKGIEAENRFVSIFHSACGPSHIVFRKIEIKIYEKFSIWSYLENWIRRRSESWAIFTQNVYRMDWKSRGRFTHNHTKVSQKYPHLTKCAFHFGIETTRNWVSRSLTRIPIHY